MQARRLPHGPREDGPTRDALRVPWWSCDVWLMPVPAPCGQVSFAGAWDARVVSLAVGPHDRAAADVYALLLDALGSRSLRRSGPGRRAVTSSASSRPTPGLAEALAAAVSALPPRPRRRR
jgi:hypothetical protein